MKIHDVLYRFVFLSCLLLLNACASSVAVESEKYEKDAVSPQRIFISMDAKDSLTVPSTFWWPAHDEADAFGQALIAGFQGCGVASSFYKEVPLSFGSTEVDKLNELHADAVLRVVNTSYVGKPPDSVQFAVYQVSLIDVKNPRILWAITLKLKRVWNGDLGQLLAQEILNKMQADHFINPSCSLSLDH